MGYLYVPASIDASGVNDVSAELNEFLAGVPDLSAVYFAEHGQYRCESTVHLDRKSDVRLHGRGATMFRTEKRTDSRGESQLRITGGDFISVDDLIIIGAGDSLFDAATEGQHNLAAYGVTKLTVKGCEFMWARGDAIHLTKTDQHLTTGVTIAVNDISATGRHGIFFRATSYVNVWANRLTLIRCEPFATGLTSHIHIHPNNSVLERLAS